MKTRAFILGGRTGLSDLAAVALDGVRLRATLATRRRMQACRRVLLGATSAGGTIYGVNTGFGELASRRVSPDALKQLQRNLVLSHACGVGEPLPPEEARAIMFLRANELSRASSGARPVLVETMARLLNAGAAPLIPSQGSVGASGDLAPQAHMALLLLGEGRALFRGRLMTAAAVLRRSGVKPLSLEAKEGLSLLNGTQAMQAVGGLALVRALRVWAAAQLAGAMSLEAMTGTPSPFASGIHALKPHPGQVRAARQLRSLLENSALRASHIKDDLRVQDPYSLRCMPQVHGAVWDCLEHSRQTVEIEFMSATDNPLVVGGRVISGGNFHGMALSFAWDSAGMALTALGNMSERRISQLVSGTSPRLAPFLARNPGLESGWMIPQVTAAALASENKVLAHPASSDSIPTSANKEDFVSMGMGAALKLRRITANCATIVAVELLCAAQGVEVHRPLRAGKGVEQGLARLRARVAASAGDEVHGPRIEAVRDLVLSGYFSEVTAS
ncbi:MAG: histidine ammonia-lyase [Elusimicrobiota bacterium]|jgi:histidine ammonia-lyase